MAGIFIWPDETWYATLPAAEIAHMAHPYFSYWADLLPVLPQKNFMLI